jgi:hypothetical protein
MSSCQSLPALSYAADCASGYVRIRQYTSAYVSIRQRTLSYEVDYSHEDDWVDIFTPPSETPFSQKRKM